MPMLSTLSTLSTTVQACPSRSKSIPRTQRRLAHADADGLDMEMDADADGHGRRCLAGPRRARQKAHGTYRTQDTTYKHTRYKIQQTVYETHHTASTPNTQRHTAQSAGTRVIDVVLTTRLHVVVDNPWKYTSHAACSDSHGAAPAYTACISLSWVTRVRFRLSPASTSGFLDSFIPGLAAVPVTESPRLGVSILLASLDRRQSSRSSTTTATRCTGTIGLQIIPLVIDSSADSPRPNNTPVHRSLIALFATIYEPARLPHWATGPPAFV